MKQTQTIRAAAAALALALTIAACGGDTDRTAEDDAAVGGQGGTTVRQGDEATGGPESSGGTAATDTTPGASAPTGATDIGGVREYTFHGTVRKIDREQGMITIDHEDIGDYMKAMTMPFKVADPALLDQVKVGQATHFSLRVAGDQALITKVQDEHAPGESH